MLTPIDFGLPAQFTAWRPDQIEAVNYICDCPQRFVMLCAPTGFGKTLAYVAAAIMSGNRTVCLTSTKGLQDQLKRDFSDVSIDIRGMQNYRCHLAREFGLPDYTRVVDAPCQCGVKCHLTSGGGNGCEYFDLYRDAQTSPLIVSNYQAWMYDQRKKWGLTSQEPVDMLVCDEAHDAVDELCSFLGVELERKEALSMGLSWPLSGYSQQEWSGWAEHWRVQLEKRREGLEERVRHGGGVGAGWTTLHEIKEIKALERKLDRIQGMKDEWVLEELGRSGNTMAAVKFDPLWPRMYREHLFRGVKKVVLVSATVRPKTAELLGIKQSELAFMEYKSSFPVENRPVIHVPTVRMNHRNEADDNVLSWWLRRIDNLIRARQDRKGIVHTVSYKRARLLVENSEWARKMIVHGSDTRAEAIERFRRAGPGTVLVSPSVDTGYDFSDDLARYQIIAKVPYPDTRGAVMKARVHEDRDYPIYLTAQILQQMTGRIVRSETDWGETLVIDDSIQWIVGKYRNFFNKWWTESLTKSGPRLPEPL